MDYSNIYFWLRGKVISAAQTLTSDTIDFDQIVIETPKEKSHGDLSTNIAMIIAKSLKISPREVALKIKEQLESSSEFEAIDVAGPGFINFKFNNNFWHKVFKHIISLKEDFGRATTGSNEKINIEFVSANPTGPMHIGHARGAIYGDALARIMAFTGYEVTREYYVNDAGSQIDTLVKSAHLRYKEAFGENITIPEGYYPGEYLKIIGEKLKEQFGEKFKNIEDLSLYNEFRKIVVGEMLALIKQDLLDMKVKHDYFFFESKMHGSLSGGKDLITETIDILEKYGLVYKGKLPLPKGEVPEDWEDREQLLFKSTDYGDDQDRSLTKTDGSWTYFAGDVAYAKNKIDRGFNKNIIILGADHCGYVRRLQAVYDALSKGLSKAQILLCQMVNFVENGKPVKMSKRAGNFTTVADVLKEVDPDVLRFIMLTRKNDVILDFDLELTKTQSKENPVFYVQYARVRALSIIENAKNHFPDIYKIFEEAKYDVEELKAEPEIALIKLMSAWPKMVLSAANSAEVHRIAYYLQELASNFHAFWNLGKEYPDYRFIIPENQKLSSARLILVYSVANIIGIGLNLLGVKPLNKM